MLDKIRLYIREDHHGLIAEPGELIPKDLQVKPNEVQLQAPLTEAKAQATPPGGQAHTTDTDDAEKAQATPAELDVDMLDAEDPLPAVYLDEEHLPNWIISRIENKQKATIERSSLF